MRWGNRDAESTAAAVDDLLARAAPPTAAFCIDDMVALWAMRRLHQRGARVPGDLALVGYDGIEFAALARVPLTTVAQPNEAIGRAAAALALAAVDADRGTPARAAAAMPPRLIVRASTGGPG